MNCFKIKKRFDFLLYDCFVCNSNLVIVEFHTFLFVAASVQRMYFLKVYLTCFKRHVKVCKSVRIKVKNVSHYSAAWCVVYVYFPNVFDAALVVLACLFCAL